MDFGNEVKKLRLLKGLGQAELANLVGVSRSHISGIELGNIPGEPMAAATLINLAKTLGQEPLYFLIGIGLLEIGELEEYRRGSFIRLPKNFSLDDQTFLLGVINFISATYERGKNNTLVTNWIEKEPEPQILGKFQDPLPDPWIDLNEQYLNEHKEEIRQWLEEQDRKAS